jgi:hypothetical protein
MFRFRKTTLKLSFLILTFIVITFFVKKAFKTVQDKSKLERIDWHDYNFIRNEETRNGPGERSGYVLTDADEIVENEKSQAIHGLSLVVSDKISVTRSLADPRNPRYKLQFSFISYL